MSLFAKKKEFGTYDASLLLHGEKTQATVISAEQLYMHRIHMTTDNRYPETDRCPHILTFTYNVLGKEYTAKRKIPWEETCPGKGETFTLYYDPKKPDRYAFHPFPVEPLWY